MESQERKYNEMYFLSVQFSAYPLVLGSVVGLRFSEICEILWPILAIRVLLCRPPHNSLKRTTSILCLVLSDFRTETARQNIVLQIPRVLKSSNKLAFKRKNC